MTKLVQTTLHSQIRKPILTVLQHKISADSRSSVPFDAHRSPTGHRSEQAVVDLDDFLDRLACDPVARSGPRIRSDNDTTLESESQRCRAMC